MQPSQQKAARWIAVVALGTSDDRFAVQLGKRITYVDGCTSLRDVLQFLAPQGGRGGDET